MMNRFSGLALIAAGISAIAILAPRASHALSTYTGTIEKVWEDGFYLNTTDDATLRVDSWDVFGDHTASQLAVGDQIIMTGEFEWFEFDAFSITEVE